MDSREEIAIAALLELSNTIHEERQHVLVWGEKRKRNARKRIANEKKPLLWNTAGSGQMEINAMLESKRKPKATQKRKGKTTQRRAQKKMKLPELQDQCVKLCTENASLTEELYRYQRMRESLHIENILLKNENPNIKNVMLKANNNHAIRTTKKEELQVEKEMKENKFVLPDLNIPLKDPFYLSYETNNGMSTTTRAKKRSR